MLHENNFYFYIFPDLPVLLWRESGINAEEFVLFFFHTNGTPSTYVLVSNLDKFVECSIRVQVQVFSYQYP